MNKDSKIYVAGHKGLVGSSIIRRLNTLGFKNIITKTKNELDLRDQTKTKKFFEDEKPEYVFLAAAKVGGIGWNSECPADFIYDNLQIQNNVINFSYTTGTKKLMFLGSVCIYPKVTPQPILEDYLLSDKLEKTNEGYALAKIAGLKMCQYYNQQYGYNAISVMPANLYGINDNFNPRYCHVIPGLLRKFHDAKVKNEETVVCFGDGSPRREFLHVDDLAEACVFLMNNYDSPEMINVGSSHDISIKDLAFMISDLVGFRGKIEWDVTKPNGTLIRKLDTTKLENLGWKSKISLQDGLRETYSWFTEHMKDARL